MLFRDLFYSTATGIVRRFDPVERLAAAIGVIRMSNMYRHDGFEVMTRREVAANKRAARTIHALADKAFAKEPETTVKLLCSMARLYRNVNGVNEKIDGYLRQMDKQNEAVAAHLRHGWLQSANFSKWSAKGNLSDTLYARQRHALKNFCKRHGVEMPSFSPFATRLEPVRAWPFALKGALPAAAPK